MTNPNKLNDLFNEIRQRNLKEDFQIGQAAQALHELKRAAKQFYDFLDGDFTVAFKRLNNDPRNIEDGAHKLMGALEAQLKTLGAVARDVEKYIEDLDTYVNPDSPSKDGHHELRARHPWGRWENQTKGK